MAGNFWSQLTKAAGALFGGTDQDIEFRDEPDLAAAALADAALGRTASLAAPPMWIQAQQHIEELRKADPNFTETDFLAQAARTYSAALAAEGAMDASPIAPLVTPAFLQTFRERIEGWRSGGFTRTVTDIQCDPPTTMKAAIGGDPQAITVRFTGTAKRFTKDDMTGLVTEGSAQPGSFVEFATFVRPAGSTTPKSLAEGAPSNCPSCGAPVEEGARTCAYCGAPLTGTGGSWLLDRASASAYT